ncbi:DUF3237 domain-containing protein [Franzmannia qiaohouensis]|uniref:UPF0311 protein QC821_08480 n=1 Tax=Franzmannia qiaohouensis TaxID=1329370 RepID=A0ABU1HD86_9GAMM|nr:DUF3237 domain-containing protein [Halomonas qiaohouensis]MDR5905306.1 DUF3237 domain-containing protein [Halomonas qiaohouensis]
MTPDASVFLDSPPVLEPVTTLFVQVDEPLEIGELASGRRRIIPILGGTFDGPRLAGEVLPGGADWQSIRADGCAEVMARYTLRTAQGSLIEVENRGVRHAPEPIMQKLMRGQPVAPDQYYFRTAPIFQTADPALAWLTRDLFVARGIREPERVLIQVFRVG